MVTASPPVSPSVVARILMIQKRSVTCGTFAERSEFFLSIFYPLLISFATDDEGAAECHIITVVPRRRRNLDFEKVLNHGHSTIDGVKSQRSFCISNSG